MDIQLPIWGVILAWSGQLLVFAAALIGLWVAMRATGRTVQGTRRAVENTQAAVEKNHEIVNSRLDQLLALTAASSFAAGRLDMQKEYAMARATGKSIE